MNGSFDISTVVFAILAIFVIWKLRSVLGTRTGNERPPFDPFVRRGQAPGPDRDQGGERGKVIPLPGAADRTATKPMLATRPDDRWQGFAPAGSPVAAGLDEIAKADPAFDAKGFLEGASGAYEMIILAFAKGDRATLAPLLAKDVYEGFAAAISDRESRGETVETTFVSIDRNQIDDAQLRGRLAQIAVRFDAKLITLTRSRDGTVKDGAPDKVSDMVDLWTFSREIGSKDPNWKLIATETAH